MFMAEELFLHSGIKLVVGFLLMLFYLHLSGKGALAPISTLDQVGNVVFGAIIGGSIYNSEISVSKLVFVAGIWAVLILIVRYVSYKSSKVKDIIDGKSIRLVKNGVMLTDSLRRVGLSIRDFVMLIRSHDVNGIDDIENAWFEYNGQLTIMKKGGQNMSTPLIENGVINAENLERLDKDEAWLQAEVAHEHLNLEEIYYAEYYKGRLWFYPYEQAIV